MFWQAIEENGFSTWLRESESPLGFYFIHLFYAFDLAQLIGADAVVDLRLLGIARDMPLRRLFSTLWKGFAMNAATGILLANKQLILSKAGESYDARAGDPNRKFWLECMQFRG